jgi:hypothetical protein
MKTHVRASELKLGDVLLAPRGDKLRITGLEPKEDSIVIEFTTRTNITGQVTVKSRDQVRIVSI